ncbi:LOW QUALITY PROTEIN: steroid 17-alpha-hydroxylase/17,20 lyase-like [Leucoraja erinacea]|uniref:LOW QUALITY PROTEIN: steroid 17-alpha-hydroxylase/17,20 lyase-like n=1 Tax=Leucoraja erinaceus TaxID=7782 RepID=UPI0024541964|nr:LOW QUALITY PROTEIN: steroid 17-alpha-hydroxylase/17,20 lyase-like [Leucoraja erinacea]
MLVARGCDVMGGPEPRPGTWRSLVQRKLKGEKYPKCLPSFPLIGSLLSLRSNLAPHLHFQNLQKTHGNLFSLMMGPRYVVVINNYQYAKEVLIKKGKIFAGRPSLVSMDLLSRDGKGIAFASYSPTWRFHRKLVHSNLYLCGNGLESLEELICKEVSSICTMLEQFVDVPLDLMTEVTRMVTNVISMLCFNSSYEKGDPEFQKILDYSEGIVDTVGKDKLMDLFSWLQYFPNEDIQTLKRSIAVRDSILQKKLEEHKANYNSESINDLLDSLLKAQENLKNNNSPIPRPHLTDDHLMMTVADIFGAGAETTSTSIAWIILYLLHYPQVQTKIQEEIENNIGYERPPNISDRSNLHFLNATISETLRSQPVAPLLIPHVALADTSIGGYTIPKDSQVIINVWAIHHDEKEWESPETFDPTRFLDTEGKYVHSPSPSFLPFGAGIRACVGEVLTKMQLFLFIATFLQHFTVEVPAGHQLVGLNGKFGIVLQPEKFKVQLKSRKAWKDCVS